MSCDALSKIDKASPVSRLRASSNRVGPVVKFKPLITSCRFLQKINHSSHVPEAKYGTVSSNCGESFSVGVVRNLYLCTSPGSGFTFLGRAKVIGAIRFCLDFFGTLKRIVVYILYIDLSLFYAILI